MRDRTHADDVIDAMTRGLDEKKIRELGVVYADLMACEIEGGYWDDKSVREVAKELGLSAPSTSLSMDNRYISMLSSEITYRLTGHRDEKITE